MPYAGILVFAALGVFAASGNPTYILVAYAIGLIGVVMRLYDSPSPQSSSEPSSAPATGCE